MAKPFEIDYIYVRSVRFGEKSSLENGVLTINRDELRALCASDLFSRLDIELASPGESCRILAIHDVMQPRCKVEHPEETYPGILGKLAPAGEGKTLALKGVVVSDIYYAKCNIKYYLDMGGPAARYSHFSKHFHVCIDAEPAEGVSDASYAEALKLASLKANVYLAKLGLGQKADYSERFEWNPIEYKPGEKRLPRVAYFATHLASHDTWNFLFYGQSALGFLPMVVQPTEILDGAMVWRYWEPNYYLQNEMYIKELLNRHGKDLEFVGCVFANNVMRLDGKETMGMIGARLCRDTLHADCVVVNKSGMGHAQLDSALAFNWMEKFGMPAISNQAAVSNYEPGDMLVIADPRVDAVISSGRNWDVEHPKVDRLIGEHANVPCLLGYNPWGPFTHTTNYALCGCWSQIGDYFRTADADLEWK